MSGKLSSDINKKENDADLKENGEDIGLLTKELEDSKKKMEEYFNNLKRCQADFINYKRRQSELFGELVDSANARLILDILPVYDAFSIAVDQAPNELKN